MGHEINVNSNINWKSSPPINGVNFFANVKFHRAILVWSWNENVRTKQKQQTNKNRVILLIYRTDTNARRLSERSGEKNFMPQNFVEINRYFALTSYGNMIGQ